MRPVTKGVTPNGYPYDIDVTSDNTLVTSLKDTAYKLKFKSTTTSVNEALKTFTPTLWQVLFDVWLELVAYDAGQIDEPMDLDDLRAAKIPIENQITTKYQSANLLLATKIGKFCSYCEQKIGESIAVEHVAPKSEYPLFSIAWANFLLSCDVCNGAANKGIKPTRKKLKKEYPTIDNEWDYYNAIRTKYVWPDTNSSAYRCMPLVLEYWSESGQEWKAVDDAASVRLGTQVTDYDLPTRRVKALIYLTDKHKKPLERLVRVHHYIAGTYRTQADETIGLLGLNKDGVGTSGSSADTRLIDRTRAWFAILGVLNLLQGVPPHNFDAVWIPVVTSLAATTGFFSVWVRILELLNWNNPSNISETLLARFLRETNNSTGFPGTNTAQIP